MTQDKTQTTTLINDLPIELKDKLEQFSLSLMTKCERMFNQTSSEYKSLTKVISIISHPDIATIQDIKDWLNHQDNRNAEEKYKLIKLFEINNQNILTPLLYINELIKIKQQILVF